MGVLQAMNDLFKGSTLKRIDENETRMKVTRICDQFRTLSKNEFEG